jgi:hypothetical protein
MTRYNTNLASEFYVLSMLYRLGLDAALTLGNKKAVDIMVTNEDRTIATIDVKGVAKRYDWPANNIRITHHNQHFYVLVSFEGKINDPRLNPSVWVVPADQVRPFMRTYKTRIVVSRAALEKEGQRFRNAWDQLGGVKEGLTGG